MSQLIGPGTSIGLKIIDKATGKRQQERNEIEESRVFVDIEPISGLSPKAGGFYKDQPKRIFVCSPDERRSETSDSMFLKITNPADEIIRNANVTVHSVHNYEGIKRTYNVHVPAISKDCWIMILLPTTFSSLPGGAFISGLNGEKSIRRIESIQYVEVEYISSKNEKLKVEANSNGRTKHYVNDTVVTAFDNAGSYIYGV